MRIRNFTKMGEGLQCCRSSPGEDLQWKREGLQCCKHSPLGEGLQCCRSSGGRSCNVSDLPGGRSAMLQTFRGEGLQGGRSAIQHRLNYVVCVMNIIWLMLTRRCTWFVWCIVKPTGDAHSSRLLVLPIGDFHMLYLLRLILIKNLSYFTGLCSHNIRTFSIFLWRFNMLKYH